MATDALSRRLRWDEPAPSEDDEVIVPQEADLIQWAAISRHGPLPLPYLYRFTAHERTNYPNLQKRYKRFYHQGWVARPPRQYASFHARYSPLVYDLTPKARAALGDRASTHPSSRSAPFLHQLMQACYTASLELAAPAHGFRFVSRSELLTHPKCEQRTLSLGLKESKLMPDDLFALERPDGKRRFFLLEIDRNTESIERRIVGYNTWKKKIDGYDEMFRDRLHTRAWGIPAASVLTVTTNATHAENLRSFVEQASSFPDRYRFMSDPTFGVNWRVPKELLTTPFEEAWMK